MKDNVSVVEGEVVENLSQYSFAGKIKGFAKSDLVLFVRKNEKKFYKNFAGG